MLADCWLWCFAQATAQLKWRLIWARATKPTRRKPNSAAIGPQPMQPCWTQPHLPCQRRLSPTTAPQQPLPTLFGAPPLTPAIFGHADHPVLFDVSDNHLKSNKESPVWTKLKPLVHLRQP